MRREKKEQCMLDRTFDPIHGNNPWEFIFWLIVSAIFYVIVSWAIYLLAVRIYA